MDEFCYELLEIKNEMLQKGEDRLKWVLELGEGIEKEGKQRLLKVLKGNVKQRMEETRLELEKEVEV